MRETVKELIEGRVAKVLNRRELVINRGSENGVEEGMKFGVIEESEEVLDPETNSSIGTIRRVKIRVKVAHVQPQLAVARTYETYDVPEASQFLLPFAPSRVQTVTKVKSLSSSQESLADAAFEEGRSFVGIGDKVVQIHEN